MRHLLEQTQKYSFVSVLDIGAGSGFASHFFASDGKEVTASGYAMDSYLSIPFPPSVRVIPEVDICDMRLIGDCSYDAVWCSHVLEHVQNPGLALAEIYRVLKPGGMLFLIVPEYAPVLVGGHVSTGWTIGTLMYNLVLAGFGVRDGELINHCWNVAGFVKKSHLPDVELRFDNGDLEILRDFFPEIANVHQGMNSNVHRINWKWHKKIKFRAELEFMRAVVRKEINDYLPPVMVRGLRGLKRILNQRFS